MLTLHFLPLTTIQEGCNGPNGEGSIEQEQNYKLNALKDQLISKGSMKPVMSGKAPYESGLQLRSGS